MLPQMQNDNELCMSLSGKVNVYRIRTYLISNLRRLYKLIPRF